MIRVPVSKLKPIKRRWIGTPRLSQKFGSVSSLTLPASLGRTLMDVPNQEGTDFCTAYGEAVSSGYKYSIPISPEYQTGMESKYLGKPILFGADATSSMDASLVFDSLPSSYFPLSLQDAYSKYGRDIYAYGPNGEQSIQKAGGASYIADPGSYDASLTKKALPYTPGIPYKVDGPYDAFDNIRSALYQAWHTDKSVVKAFGYWYESFNIQANDPAQKGRVDNPMGASPVSLHRYNFIDWVTDPDGTIWLVAALTQGTDFGDRGHLYMKRDCVNFLFSNIASQGLGLYISKPASYNLDTTIAWFRSILAYLANRTF